ncbi:MULTISPECIES: hypothetical protein [Crocosphaera]|uniref:Uncharacterized protein n=5 Tax=Crocosphaera watsonii TaxID=263511 RepID=T2JTL9_CROWT|nr:MULTISPECIES: hypothetical protein [Crocosphaera]MCH2246238.1 hypothetical protein [Crocosphaera sp.]NQZ61733.1 hypothetical protein [Crocosphaera sp.]CCQ68560.1 hypothetical protein CWATWH0402_1361 [Crocosphaera watsonii WH 0402]
MTLIKIHEFSTGVIIQGTPSQWWIAEFMKERDFMNSTLDKIPYPVERAISQELLTIYDFPENTKSPVIIGREVRYRREAWSVLAVVTLGEDEPGNKVCLYRYFVTEGLGKITDLLSWYNRNHRPSFDPFDRKKVGQHHDYDDDKTLKHDALSKLEFQNLLTTTRHQRLVVPSYIKCTPVILNQLAERIKKKKQLIAWGFNVENIFKSRTFQVLHLSQSSPLNPPKDPPTFLNKLLRYIITINHNITDFVNHIYLSIVTPIKVPPLLLFMIFLGGSVLIAPTFLIAFFSTQFFYGLVWGFGMIFIFFFGLEIGRRIR